MAPSAISRKRSRSAVDHEGALIAGLHHDIAAIAQQHIYVVADSKDMDIAVARFGIGRAAGFGKTIWRWLQLC